MIPDSSFPEYSHSIFLVLFLFFLLFFFLFLSSFCPFASSSRRFLIWRRMQKMIPEISFSIISSSTCSLMNLRISSPQYSLDMPTMKWKINFADSPLSIILFTISDSSSSSSSSSSSKVSFRLVFLLFEKYLSMISSFKPSSRYFIVKLSKSSWKWFDRYSIDFSWNSVNRNESDSSMLVILISSSFDSSPSKNRTWKNVFVSEDEIVILLSIDSINNLVISSYEVLELDSFEISVVIGIWRVYEVIVGSTWYISLIFFEIIRALLRVVWIRITFSSSLDIFVLDLTPWSLIKRSNLQLSSVCNNLL